MDEKPLDVEMAEPAWLPERLERARHAAIQGMLDTLGYADLDALRAALASLPVLIGERDDARQHAQEAEAARRAGLIEAAFLVETRHYDFIDLDDARRLMNLAAVDVDAENRVLGMAEAVHDLVDRRPHLLRRRGGAALDATSGALRPPAAPTRAADLPAEQVAAIKQRFKLG